MFKKLNKLIHERKNSNRTCKSWWKTVTVERTAKYLKVDDNLVKCVLEGNSLLANIFVELEFQ
ncbi:hypothetical protein CJ030_MR3G015109 [Morella rubra]|uniref:Uncharacterized protein n=1 Tax=Morella rubra TaxID=262757 RepID=A0A6A1W1K6_9ROSI|nr:hypothetical protein CJ030_MR3G015109 [Morella rubra]